MNEKPFGFSLYIEVLLPKSMLAVAAYTEKQRQYSMDPPCKPFISLSNLAFQHTYMFPFFEEKMSLIVSNYDILGGIVGFLLAEEDDLRGYIVSG